jgi:hypothetical protein
MLNADDEAQLAYATSQGMVLLTSNAHHFVGIAKRLAKTAGLMLELSSRPSSLGVGILANYSALS